jgi:hypothetical protein
MCVPAQAYTKPYKCTNPERHPVLNVCRVWEGHFVCIHLVRQNPLSHVLYISVHLSLSVCLCLSLYVCVSVCVCVCLSVSLSLSLCLSVWLWLWLWLCLLIVVSYWSTVSL